MSFISPEFAIIALLFFPIFWALSSQKYFQKIFLLISSYALYSTWSVEFAIILLIYSSYIWMAGKWLNQNNPAKKIRLKLAITSCLALATLFISKYYELSRTLLIDILPQLGLHSFLPVIDFIAPAGISFFTFQAITYLVWQAQEKPSQTSFLDLLLYLSFWPTLFAGPIMRAKDFHEQLQHPDFGKPKESAKAIYFIVLGLFQKIVLASWLSSTYVDQVFKYPDQQTTVSTMSGILGYSLQIFFDFSGYSLIVTGLALCLGLVLPINFQQPLLARNIKDFWRRWHISLSTFIRDFIYIPLGGNQHGFTRSQINIVIAMFISGIWHGAGTGFAIWGLLHGIGLVGYNLFVAIYQKPLPSWLGVLLTMCYVGISWIFFRSNHLDTALIICKNLFLGTGALQINDLILLLFTGFFLWISMYSYSVEQKCLLFIGQRNLLMIIPILTFILFVIILLGPSGVPGFIYYQF